MYDGAQNPIGRCFTKDQFRMLLEPWFEIEETYLHYFPARSLPFTIPRFACSWFDRHLGFMLDASVRRRPETGGDIAPPGAVATNNTLATWPPARRRRRRRCC